MRTARARQKLYHAARLAIAPAGILALQQFASAGTVNWRQFTTTGTLNWNDANNWTTGIPGTNDSSLIINFDPSAPGTSIASGGVSQTFTANNDLGTVSVNQLNLSGTSNSSSTSRTININGGTLLFQSASATISNGTTTNGASGRLNYSIGSSLSLNADLSITLSNTGTMTFAGGVSAVTSPRTITLSGTGTSSFSGPIGDGSGKVSFTQNGTGTVTFSGTNTFTGDILINSGTVAATGATADTSLGQGNTIKVGNTSGSQAATLILGNAGYANAITVQNNSGLMTIQNNGNSSTTMSGLVTVNKDVTIIELGTSGGTMTFNGTISGSGNLILQNNGTSNISLGNTNSGFTGAVSITSGTTRVTAAAALNSANFVSVDSQNASVFNINNNSITIAGLKDGANGGGTVTNTGTTLKTLTLAGSGTYSYGGDITASTLANMGLAVALTGNGSQVLSGTTHYAGATSIASGRLIVNGNIAASSGVAINANGTLAGSGTISSVNAAGVVSPGNGKGILTTGNLTINGGTLAIDLSKADARATQDPLAGTDYDQLSVGGTVSLSSATLALSGGPGMKNGDLYFILVNDGADSINGAFSGLPAGLFTTQGMQFQISYVADSTGIGSMSGGNDIALQAIAVPEASMLSVLGLGAVAMLRRRRRANAGLPAR